MSKEPLGILIKQDLYESLRKEFFLNETQKKKKTATKILLPLQRLSSSVFCKLAGRGEKAMGGHLLIQRLKLKCNRRKHDGQPPEKNQQLEYFQSEISCKAV